MKMTDWGDEGYSEEDERRYAKFKTILKRVLDENKDLLEELANDE